MSGAVAAWNRFWFAPTSTSTLGVFRIAFAAVILAWSVSLAPDVLTFASTDGLLPEHPDDAWRFGLFQVLESDLAVIAVYVVLLLASVFVLVGFRTRLAAVLLFVCLLSFQRRSPSVYNSGDLLLRILAFYLVFAPAGAALSIDRWRSARRGFWQSPARAPWALRLVQVQLSVLYLAAVWAKARGESWNDGLAVSYALRVEDLERFPVPFVADSLLLTNLATYGTLAVELSLALLIWNRKLRPWVIGAGVALHLGIDFGIMVGFFSYAIFVAYISFVPPDVMDAWVVRLRERLGRSGFPPFRRLAAIGS